MHTKQPALMACNMFPEGNHFNLCAIFFFSLPDSTDIAYFPIIIIIFFTSSCKVTALSTLAKKKKKSE